MHDLMLQKAVKVYPSIASVCVSEMLENRYALANLKDEFAKFVGDTVAARQEKGLVKLAGVIAPEVINGLMNVGKMPKSAVITIRDRDVLHGLRDFKQDKRIDLDFWKDLPSMLLEADYVMLDSGKKKDVLIYVFAKKSQKIAVTLDYVTKQLGKSVVINSVTTGGIVKDILPIINNSDYTLLYQKK